MRSAGIKEISAICGLVLLAIGCSGGGGGSSSSSSTDSLERSTHTAVRLIHASVDSAPLDATIGTEWTQQARYGEAINYKKISSSGAANVLVSKALFANETVATLPIDLAKDTEYSVLIYGGANDLKSKVVVDNTIRPESGKCLLRVLNAVQGIVSLSIKTDAFVATNVGYGTASTFVTVGCGVQTFHAISEEGAVLASVAVDVPDQGEVTVVVSGNKEIGYYTAKAYLDLD